MSRPAVAPSAVAAQTAPTALVLRDVTRAHAGRPVWQPLDLELEPGAVAVVTGSNGSGKTTLLRLAAGLLRPTTGTRACPGSALYVRAGSGLRSAQTVGDAVASTAGLAGRQQAAPAALSACGLDGLATRRLGTLSAGERVRATLACALAVQPALLCLDEPTGALDESGLSVLVGVVERLRGAGTALLIATHQPAALLPVADAHLRLADGQVVPA